MSCFGTGEHGFANESFLAEARVVARALERVDSVEMIAAQKNQRGRTTSPCSHRHNYGIVSETRANKQPNLRTDSASRIVSGGSDES